MNFDIKENFKQEAIASWKNYQETGLHLNNIEAQDWLNHWGVLSSKQEKPVCHQ